MRIVLGSDHRGVAAKERLAAHVRELGHEVHDLGAFGPESIDYPDIAAQVGHEVAQGEAQRGILLCGTGIGMSIAANKVTGVRAAAVSDEKSAEMARKHNDLNVLCLPADLLEPAQIDHLVDIYLTTPFEAGGRHSRRIEKIAGNAPCRRISAISR